MDAIIRIYDASFEMSAFLLNKGMIVITSVLKALVEVVFACKTPSESNVIRTSSDVDAVFTRSNSES